MSTEPTNLELLCEIRELHSKIRSLSQELYYFTREAQYNRRYCDCHRCWEQQRRREYEERMYGNWRPPQFPPYPSAGTTC